VVIATSFTHQVWPAPSGGTAKRTLDVPRPEASTGHPFTATLVITLAGSAAVTVIDVSVWANTAGAAPMIPNEATNAVANLGAETGWRAHRFLTGLAVIQGSLVQWLDGLQATTRAASGARTAERITQFNHLAIPSQHRWTSPIGPSSEVSAAGARQLCTGRDSLAGPADATVRNLTADEDFRAAECHNL
jgi:hypothetical protein